MICTHERRPGTTVCLHCRHAERLAARARRKRFLLRASAVGIVATVFVAGGVAAAVTIRGKLAPRHAARVAPVTRPTAPTIDSASGTRAVDTPVATVASTPGP